MEPLTIFLHWNCFGQEHGWSWLFPSLMFLGFIMMCILFRGWRRRTYSCWWPGWSDNRYNVKSHAKEILKERYAKGEINKDDYDKMMEEIR